VPYKQTFRVHYFQRTVLARLMLDLRHMTNTEFIVREKHGEHHPLFNSTQMHFLVVDGAIILGVLATFLGLVLLLSK
jgi:hypothetical protein